MPATRKNKRDPTQQKKAAAIQQMEEPSPNSQMSVVSKVSSSIKDTQYEINAVLNTLTKEIFMDKDGVDDGDFQKVNVHVINQVFTMLAGADLHQIKKDQKRKSKKVDPAFPPKLVQKSFTEFLYRMITADTKDSNLKPLFKSVDSILYKIVQQKLLSIKNGHSFQLVEAMLDFLSGIYLIPNVNTTVKIRTALMMSQVMKITYPSGYLIKHTDILVKVEKAAIDMIWQ